MLQAQPTNPSREIKTVLTELSRRFPGERVVLTESWNHGPIPPAAHCSARSKLARLGVDSPTAFQWVAKRERSADWNRIRTAAELRRAAAADFEARSAEGRYLSEADPLLNRLRLATVREWREYLTKGNDDYAGDPFWQACAWAIVDSELKGTRSRGPGLAAPLHKGALAALRASLASEVRPVSFPRRYGRLRAEYARLGAASVPAGGKRVWLYLPSKAEAKRRFRENVERLRALSAPTWCTKTHHAEVFLERGGFWLLLDGNTAIAALRLVGPRIQELAGVKNDGAYPVEAAAEIDALLASRKELEGVELWRVRNPNASDELLAAAVAEAPAEVGRLAARHPNAGAATLHALAGSSDPETRLLVAERADPPAAVLSLLADGTDARTLTAVARHPNTPPPTLAELGTREFNGVRAAVASHPATPAATLSALETDASKLVRGAVGGNPNTPPETLAGLAEDGYYGVRGDVAGNPNTPACVLVRLLEDEHPYVCGRAAENPNAPLGSISARCGVEAYYDPNTDTCVFLLDRIESAERAAALFFHERTHRLLARLARTDAGASEDLLLSLAPGLIADLPALLRRSGYANLDGWQRAYGFGETKAGRLSALGELLARQAERLAEGSPSPEAMAERAREWWTARFGRPPK